MKYVKRLLGALLAVSASTLPAVSDAGAAPANAPHAVISALPLSFEPTASPGERSEFVAHGPNYAIGLSEKGAALALGSEVIRLEVLGARAAKPTAEQPLPGVVNYVIGNDPTQWRTGIKTFAQVRYSGVYPGVDLLYYGTQGRLEYDFAVAPGASAAPIRLAFAGADAVRVDARGNLGVSANGHEVVFERPVAYQMRDGQRAPVAARYQLSGETVRFQLGAYDHGKRLIIDPVLSYFSYLGGSGYDVAGIATPTGSPYNTSGQAAALDAAGDLYVTGYTESTNFPVKAAYETAPAKVQGGTPPSAFITKFAPDGKSVIFSTYLGGTVGADQAASIAVDSSGNAIVVGTTGSNDFPVTSGAYQTVCNPKFVGAPGVESPNCPGGSGYAAFVSKFSPSGALLYSTFLSGSNTQTTAYAVALDTSGRVYVAGDTMPGAIVPAGTGGSNQTIPFPTTAGAVLTTPPYSTGVGGYQNVLSATYDAFISVFDPTLSTLLYSSLFGEPQVSNAGLGFGSASFTIGQAVTVDASGNFYLAGTSEDASLETTAGAYEANASSCGTVTNNTLLNCAFVAKFSPVPVGTGTPSLIYGTYLGHTVLGSYGDLMTGIAADAAGDAYITGYTNQATFPTTAGAYQTTCDQYGVNGNTNADCGSGFIAKLNPSGTALLASTYFGGYYAGANGISDNVSSMGPIVLDAAGNVYIGGVAANDLPQVNPLGTNNGTGGATSPFVAKFNSSLTTLEFSTLFSTGGQSGTDVDGLALDTTGNIYIAGSVGSPPSSAATSGAFQSAYGGGSSDAFVAKIVVHTATTTTLSATPSSAAVGTAVAFTAMVKPTSGSGVPTGTVTFQNGSTVLGSATLNGTGQATYTASSLAVGTYSVTAAYGGDGANLASTSTAVAVTITPAPIASTTALVAAPTTATVHTAVVFTASVAPATGSNVPTGTVTFKDGTTTLGTATLASGKASYSNSALTAGAHSITASYGGDALDAASTSAAVSVTIKPAIPAAPTGVTATGGNAQVTLSWAAASGATSYNIYQGTSAGGESKTPVQSGVSGTGATVSGLTNGTGYFFTVAAVNAGGTSAASVEASATPVAPVASSGGGHSGGGAIGGNLLLGLLVLVAQRMYRVHRSSRRHAF
jgi:hypothetical protein